MIKIKVSSSPDSDKCLEYQYEFPHISIGRSMRCHLIIDDREIMPHHIDLRLVGDQLYCYNINSNFFLNNGLKFKGGKLQKINDTITIGKTNIKIIDFAPLKEEVFDIKKLFKNSEHMNKKVKKKLKKIEARLIEIGLDDE